MILAANDFIFRCLTPPYTCRVEIAPASIYYIGIVPPSFQYLGECSGLEDCSVIVVELKCYYGCLFHSDHLLSAFFKYSNEIFLQDSILGSISS